MKYEWKKEEKDIYLPKDKPTLVNIPKTKFFCIKGKGNPNNEDFTNRVGILYALSYAVRMMPKKGYIPEGYYEYTVYPLEGLWDLSDKGKKSTKLLKDELLYTIMIKQPSFVNADVIKKAFEIVKKKKDSYLLKEAYFEEIEDGLSVQILHNGPYDNESESFKKMKEFIINNGLVIKSLIHREIYINDSRKTDKNKLKTVLRYRVFKK